MNAFRSRPVESLWKYFLSQLVASAQSSRLGQRGRSQGAKASSETSFSIGKSCRHCTPVWATKRMGSSHRRGEKFVHPVQFDRNSILKFSLSVWPKVIISKVVRTSTNFPICFAHAILCILSAVFGRTYQIGGVVYFRKCEKLLNFRISEMAAHFPKFMLLSILSVWDSKAKNRRVMRSRFSWMHKEK